MKTYRRYVSIYSNEEAKTKFQEDILFIDKDIPDVPHWVIDINAIKYVPTYGNERPRPSLHRRLITIGKEIAKILKHHLF